MKFNKKGQTGSSFNIFLFIIGAFLVVMLFAGWIFISGLLNDVFTQVGVINEANAGQPFYTNMSEATEIVWGNHLESIRALRMVAIVYILALGVSIIIVGFLERKHPFMFFLYILLAILAVIFAPSVSNAYEMLLESGVFGGELVEFTGANFLLLNLPVVVLIISVLGAIGLFINLIRGGQDNLGGSIY